MRLFVIILSYVAVRVFYLGRGIFLSLSLSTFFLFLCLAGIDSVMRGKQEKNPSLCTFINIHTHTHTHIYVYIFGNYFLFQSIPSPYNRKNMVSGGMTCTGTNFCVLRHVPVFCVQFKAAH